MRRTFTFLVACLLAGGAPAQPVVDVRPVPATRTGSALPAHWHRGAFMEIFVRAWKDSNGDGIGDLRGLTSTLGELHALGVRGLWLMPITGNADGDHGYATTDFRNIAPEYGTLADFDGLIREANKLGIGIVIDYVINHSAAAHPAFVAARQDPASPWRDWFVWAEQMPQGWDIWGKNPWYQTRTEPWTFKGDAKDLPTPAPDARDFYFGTFGPHMPDFNLRNPAVLAYHEDSLRFWLNRGLAGYRLDAVPHMVENSAKDWNDQPESRALTKRLQDLIKTYRHRYVVCEATAEPQAYGDPAVCGGAFAFGHVQHYVGAALGKADSVAKLAGYWKPGSLQEPTMATFLSNHDIFAGRRLWDQLAAQEGVDEATRSAPNIAQITAQYKLAAAAYLLQPGTPFIYYGEEIGQAGVHTLKGDLPLRSPYSWTADPATAGFTTGTPFRPVAPNLASHNLAAQKADPGSIWHFYKAMLALRNTRPEIQRGSFDAARADGLVLQFQRRLGRAASVVLINYGADAATAAVTGLPAGARLVRLYPQPGRRNAAGAVAGVVGAGGALKVWIGAREVQVYRLRR